MNRIQPLEGLRGILALIVINEHILKLYCASIFADYRIDLTRAESFDVLSLPPFILFYNGAWPVCMFFVLTGFVLNHSFFKRRTAQKSLLQKSTARYVRLTLPVLASLLFAWLLIQLGLMDLKSLYSQADFYHAYDFSTPPSLTEVLLQAFWHTPFMGIDRYNPPLWTIFFEVIGSLLIFCLHALFSYCAKTSHASVYRLLLYSCALTLSYNSLFLGFFLGMILYECYQRANLQCLNLRLKSSLSMLLIVIGLLFCSYTTRNLSSLLLSVGLPLNHSLPSGYIVNTWGACILLAGLLLSNRLCRLLSQPAMLCIGRLSFPLYITHFLVLYSVSTNLFILMPIENYAIRVCLSISLTFPVIFLVAYLFECLVNQPSIKISSTLSRRLTFVNKH